ncbi:MAG TPA: GTP cyclohydrolase II [Polyangiaceae bacterium]|nr:GTP cyclohydrolase II [Polyangiaceae bacterium]
MSSAERLKSASSRLELLASAPLPTHHGSFQLRVYGWDDPIAHPALSKEHCALVMGEVRGKHGVPVRVHSECLTSEVFGSMKCDCREQFERAQAEIARRGIGVLLYLRQEGRGIGLANKVRAYALQALGADTIEANQLLHLPVDARTYDVAAAVLRELGVESVELLTNNPEKIAALQRLGVHVDKRVPVLVAANPYSASYLEVKRRRMQHELPNPNAGMDAEETEEHAPANKQPMPH